MTRIITLQCDRCAKILEQPSMRAGEAVVITIPQQQLDLCAECYCNFRDWMGFARVGLDRD